MKNKTARFLNYTFKLILVIGLLGLLYKEVGYREDAGEMVKIWAGQWQRANCWWLVLAFCLMPVNWLLEAYKWKVLLSAFYPVKISQAIKGVLAGVSLSLFTPNRVGDYGGRILAVPARHNWHALLATAIGSYAQLLVLITGGLGAVFYFIRFYSSWPQLLMTSFGWLSCALLLLAYFFFFNINTLIKLIDKLALPKRFQHLFRYIYELRQFQPRQLGKALELSMLRYIVYCLQYYMIIRFVGIEAPFWGALSGIASIFLIQSSVPLPPLAALLARGEAALIIWGHFSENSIGILAATFGLFILNLCIPALFGLGIIVRINILKSLGYEKENPENNQPATNHIFLNGLRIWRKNKPSKP
jgi:hypothetical protein